MTAGDAAADRVGAPPPDAPDAPVQPQTIALTATTDVPEAVWLRWMVTGGGAAPARFVVRRDGVDLAVLRADVTSYDDAAAEPGTLGAPPYLVASQGTRTDAVALTWPAAPAAAGAPHAYQVVAYDDTMAPTSSSNVASGARAAPVVLGYEFSRDSDTAWSPAGLGPSFDDTGAPMGSIVASATATAQYPARVRLQLTGEPTVTPPAPSRYRVRARTAADAGPASPPALGYRGVGTVVSYQWQRSAGDSDGGYTDLAGVQGATWLDTAPPRGQGRYYRAAMSADGAAGVTAAVRAQTLAARQVSVGYDHVCALLSDSTVVCWGQNGSGQAPPGPSADTFKSVSAGQAMTCGVRTDDTVRCWGSDTNGGTEAPDGVRFKSVSAGMDPFACGVRLDDDKVVCWGYNVFSAAPRGPSADSYQSVSAGSIMAWGVRTDGLITCWGDSHTSPVPAQPSTDQFQSVSAGGTHACGIRADGKLLCWGPNTTGGAPPGPSTD